MSAQTTTLPAGGVRGAVLPAGVRPSPAGALSASLAFGWRALLKIKHVPLQLFDVIVHPVVFTLMFTFLFGGAVAGSTGRYLQYVLPGILAMTLLVTTGYIGSALSIDISKGVFDRFRSLPIWRPSVLVGAILGDLVRYAIASTGVVLFGLALGFRPAGGPVGVLAGVLLALVFSFSLAWLWTLLGLLMRTSNAVLGVTQGVLYPLVFFSNIFVMPATLPGWLQAFVRVNPVTHLVVAVRGLMAGTATAGQVGWVLVASAVLTAVFAPLAMYRYRRV
jgi:ABC-2 type transport system permease protein